MHSVFGKQSISLDGRDMRTEPIEERKHALANLLFGNVMASASTLATMVTVQTSSSKLATLGCEGIVSKRLGSAYRMGRTDTWIKIKKVLSR
jgi:bifunctional non-homologous end joining protein LigD